MTKMSKRGFMEGRPTKYKEEYCESLIEFFSVQHYTINEQGKREANSLPTFERFAAGIRVHIDTMHEWKQKYSMFSEAYTLSQYLQKDMVNNLAILGLYNSQYSQFFAKNCLGMKDKTEVETNDVSQLNYEKWLKENQKTLNVTPDMKVIESDEV